MAPALAKRDEEELNLSEQAYLKIKHKILQNIYPGGFQVLEDTLSEDLGMSRTPLKEALVRLANEGLIEILPRRGMRILPLTASDIAEIYEVLSPLELLAARLLAERQNNIDSVKALQAEVDQMKRALTADDLDAWAAADERFHRTLVDETGNTRLATAAKNLLDQSQRFRMFTLRLREKPVRSTRNHESLVTSIRKHDATKAVSEHAVHRANWHEYMTELMKKFGIRHI